MCKFIVNEREILNNFIAIKSQLKSGVKICAVVKANAYGFGAQKICSLLTGLVDYFAVARLSEFIKIENECHKPCLILSPLSEKESIIATKRGAEITISSSTNLALLNELAQKNNLVCKVHLKLDTGMNRYGLKTDEKLCNFLETLKTTENIKLVGCYSHIFEADNIKITSKQRNKFQHFKKIILAHGYRPFFHFANSVGLKNELNQFDMVRVGLDMYMKSQKSEHRLVCYINEIKQVKKGETISYNARYKARRNITIAICSAGYADGVNRKLSNKGRVLIHGKKARILGNVCMDCFMADITAIGEAKIGDEVVIFGKSGELFISVCDLAKICGTIPYEIYTSISSRVKRIYRWRT